MLRDDNKGRTDKVFPEISRNDWNGQSRTEREHSTSTEIHDHLQHETKDIIAEGNRKHIRSIEQAMCSRNGDNRRVGLPLGGGSIGNRERMVWEPEGAAYDTANRKERNIQERKGAFKQLKRTFGIERINSGGDGSVLLEANYDESNGGDFRRSVRVAECTPKCTDHSKEGITRHLCGSSAERFNQTSPNMRKSTRNLGENDTTRLLFAWHVAALEHGIEHRWLELMCLLQETKN